MKVVVVGSGNVAESLAQAIAEAEGLELVQLFARNEERGRKVAELAHTKWSNTSLAEADLYLISVSDNAVDWCAKSLHIPKNAVVAHTAGCCSIDTLAPHTHRAVFYPFQTFSVGRKVDFAKGYIFLEGATDHALQTVREAAHRLTSKVELADSARRAVIHLSGVFACNFANAMYANAAEVLASAGLPFDIVAPVIAETAQKAIEILNPAATQTGPARRGDTQTLDRHRAMLTDKPRTQEIYDKISEDICERTKISKSY
uniref:Rossmann-like and DUF2520 domain-containing protein n=1 Tax=Alistipes sp. TaxID=1872444 RepID=UPI0040575332